MEPPTKTQKYHFQPSLFTRIIQAGGASEEGNVSPSSFNPHNALFTLMLWTSIFFASLYFATLITKSPVVIDHFFKDVDINDPTLTFKERYGKIILFSFFFIAMIVGFHILIAGGIYAIFSSFDMANRINNIFWKYGDTFLWLSVLSTIGLFVIFCLYFAMAPSYISNLAYSDYLDPSETDKEEYSDAVKYILHLRNMIVYVFCFLLALFVYHFFVQPFNMKFFAYYMAFILVIVILSTYQTSFELRRKVRGVTALLIVVPILFHIALPKLFVKKT